MIILTNRAVGEIYFRSNKSTDPLDVETRSPTAKTEFSKLFAATLVNI